MIGVSRKRTYLSKPLETITNSFIFQIRRERTWNFRLFEKIESVFRILDHLKR